MTDRKLYVADFHALPAPDLDDWRTTFIEFINQVRHRNQHLPALQCCEA